jgi:Carboxypeptidase regulatory-like domain
MAFRTSEWIAALAAVCMAASVGATATQTPVPVTVTGQVVSAITGAPVGGAQLSLNVAAIDGARRTAITGDDGRFFIDNVPGGRYYLFASRPGFFTAGLNDEWQPGSSDVLVVGWPGPPFVTMKLRPHGGIAGRVSDEENRPVAGAKVTALSKQQAWPSWGRRWTWDPQVNLPGVATNEHGEYILDAVPPGDYVIRVDADNVRIPGAVPRTFGTTYSPGSSDIPGTLPFHLDIGERRVTDVRLSAKAAFDLGGFVGAPADAPSNASVYLQLFSIDDAGEEYSRPVAEQRPRSGGPFTFTHLPAGDYVISANINEKFWAEQRIRLDDRSLTDVQVRLLPAIVVSGSLVWEGTAQPPDRSTLVEPISSFVGDRLPTDEITWLRSRPIGLAEMMPVGRTRPTSQLVRSYQAIWTSDKTFTLTVPRERFLAGSGRANGWMVKSFRINGHEATEEPVDLGSNSTDAVLTLTRALGEVRGSIVTPAGGPAPWCPVVVFSTNQRTWPGFFARQGLHVLSNYSDDNGHFTFPRVLPGDYYLAAISRAEMENLDPELLSRLGSSAMRIQVPASLPVSRMLTRPR